MTKKTIKILFFSLFTLDILAGIVVFHLVSPIAGITTAFVLLSLNGVVFAIMMKMFKVGEKHGRPS